MIRAKHASMIADTLLSERAMTTTSEGRLAILCHIQVSRRQLRGSATAIPALRLIAGIQATLIQVDQDQNVADATDARALVDTSKPLAPKVFQDHPAEAPLQLLQHLPSRRSAERVPAAERQ